MADYNTSNLVTLGQMQALAQVTKGKLDQTFKSLAVSGNTVNFFGSTDASGTALASFDFPEELYLSQTGTEIVENFTFSEATYPGATNPSLEGKTVLVLAVKGNGTPATVKYSFVDMAKVIETISAGDNSINVDGYAISVKISATTGNLLELKSDGLFVGSDDTKVDKVTAAVSGNIAVFGTNGALADSGFTVAGDSDVVDMLNGVFGAGSITSI